MISKAIWLIAGGEMQVPAAEYIVAKGYKLILSDRDPVCACAIYADEFLNIDTFDVKANVDKIPDLRLKYDICAVFTAAADCHETVSLLAACLGVHGIDPKISRICRNKLETRKLLSEAGLPQPRYFAVSTLKAARMAAFEMHKDCVIKATDNSGSRGFSYIKKGEQITEWQFENALSHGTTGLVIIEEALIPRKDMISEQSIETVWHHNGFMCTLNAVDRIFACDLSNLEISEEMREYYCRFPSCFEIGHINPAHDTTAHLRIVAGNALGMTKQPNAHILKFDIMHTVDGPVILEMTPRLSGGWDSSGTTFCRGANFIGGAIELALGREFDRNLFEEYFVFKKPEVFAVALRDIPTDAFNLGTGSNAKEALAEAFK